MASLGVISVTFFSFIIAFFHCLILILRVFNSHSNIFFVYVLSVRMLMLITIILHPGDTIATYINISFIVNSKGKGKTKEKKNDKQIWSLFSHVRKSWRSERKVSLRFSHVRKSRGKAKSELQSFQKEEEKSVSVSVLSERATRRHEEGS